MPTETERLLHELAQEVRGLRAEIGFIRNELRHMAGGLAMFASQSKDNKKKSLALLNSSRVLTTGSESLNRPGN
jgi:hypothetical protein